MITRDLRELAGIFDHTTRQSAIAKGRPSESLGRQRQSKGLARELDRRIPFEPVEAEARDMDDILGGKNLAVDQMVFKRLGFGVELRIGARVEKPQIERPAGDVSLDFGVTVSPPERVTDLGLPIAHRCSNTVGSASEEAIGGMIAIFGFRAIRPSPIDLDRERADIGGNAVLSGISRGEAESPFRSDVDPRNGRTKKTQSAPIETAAPHRLNAISQARKDPFHAVHHSESAPGIS